MINVIEFSTLMEQHWKELGNVSNPGLWAAWQQMAETFNRLIRDHDYPETRPYWYVLQPPTGSGKSLGARLYCSMLNRIPIERHPGVLLVVRQKVEADMMATQTNDMSGRAMAVAYHSDNRLPLDELKDYPVLVITQCAYEQALDYLGETSTIEKTWPYFHAWRNGSRKLVIIDEAINVIEHFEAGLNGLRQTLGVIPQDLRDCYPAQIGAMEWAIQLMEKLDQTTRKTQEQMIKQVVPDCPDLSPLRVAMRALPYDQLVLHRHDVVQRQQLRETHDRTMKDLNNILKSWIYYARSNKDHALHTARLIVPEGVKGGVILDATASSNVVYELFDPAYVVPAPPNVRSYANVTLHFSRGHNVGKGSITKNLQQNCSDLIAVLNTQVTGRKVFIACHKDTEALLKSYETTFEMSVGHWKAIDGKNRWQDCDVAVVFGLPFLPSTWPVKTFCALQGPQNTDWLKSPENRQWGGHDDIRLAIQRGQMITEVIQAINRVRCRRVVDEAGNCQPTDVFILLPDEANADALLKGIETEMPGIRIHDWDFSGCKRKKAGRRKSKHDEILMTHLRNIGPGRYPAGQVKKLLGIPDTSFDRLIAEMKTEGTALHGFMEAAGIRYDIDTTSKSNPAYFVKK